MRITDQQLRHDLEVLRHGGQDAVLLFFETARKFFDKGGSEYLESWVTAAAPALPEADRHAVMTALMRAMFGDTNVYVSKQELHTLQ
jgi:hypothetical protein